MNKRIIISLIMIGLLAFGAGLGTYAWFTSEVASTNGVFESGTLKIDVNGSSNNNDEFEIVKVDKIAPGDVLPDKTIRIKSTGNLNLAMFKKLSLVIPEGMEEEEVEDFAKQLLLTSFHVKDWSWDEDGIQPGTTNWKTENNWSNEWDADGDGIATLYDLATAPHELGGGWTGIGLKPGEEQTITISLKMNELADNSYQGMSAILKMEVKATQINNDAIKSTMKDTGLNLGVDYEGSYFKYMQNR